MPAPLVLFETRVKPEWLDEYGHMNVANYVLVCDQATYAFWEYANDGLTLDQRQGAEYAVVETHVNYLREVRLNDPLKVVTQLLGCDTKRFRLFHTMYHVDEESVAATNEIMALGFDLNTRDLMSFRPEVSERLSAILNEHSQLPVPKNAGRAIAMQRARKA